MLYLPPYSPDLNPIEQFFGELKRYIQEVWGEFEDLIREDFAAFLKEAVRVVGRRRESAEGHLRWDFYWQRLKLRRRKSLYYVVYSICYR